ncbi:hypothetical protein [Patulibacter sp.]|uniref:hypothetical protein n=1 Tax=Patulibacter sp. TaxID=1912859 RepID=UPI002718CC94|nr:hypothetical protein [Patulibacter sp.]MDO9408424.1 hypothetical protein [Patulibacter sp.]
MSLLTPQNAARAIGVGRIAFGAALLAVPARIGESWLGEGGAGAPAQVALRGLGARDAVIGMAMVHTAGDRDRGSRWARTSAAGDITDIVATVAARGLLPRSGVLGTVALGGATAAASVAVSEWLRRQG